MLDIAGVPAILLLTWIFPPLVIVPVCLMNYGMARNFGRGLVFAIGITICGYIFMPLLAFGPYHYQEEWRFKSL